MMNFFKKLKIKQRQKATKRRLKNYHNQYHGRREPKYGSNDNSDYYTNSANASTEIATQD